jgi:hypothetical protein
MSRASKWILLAVVCVVGAIAVTLGMWYSAHSVVGEWVLESTNVCSLPYPAGLEFFRDGRYVTNGPSIWWTGGPYGIVDHARIRMETLTGPTLYDFTIQDDRLSFVNSAGCEIVYVRRR